MKYYIYKIVNSVDDKVYIGSTKDFNQRIRTHKNDIKHKNASLQRHIKTIGLEYFEFVLVHEIDVETKLDARIAEQAEINKYNEEQLLNDQKARMTKEDRIIDHSRTNRIWYLKLKSDPERYKTYLQQKKEWKKQWRAKKLI